MGAVFVVCIVGECNCGRHLEDIEVIKALDNAQIDCKDAVVIIGSGGSADVRCALGVIVDGERFSGELPKGVQLITCGISPKNTVSITSRNDEKITLSLNRTIRALSGIIEPLEQPFDAVGGDDEYGLMAAFAARLLLEN